MLRYLLCLSFGLISSFVAAEELGAIAESKLVDIDGQSHDSAEWKNRKATVLIFLGTDCPVSNGYAPEIQRIYESGKSSGVAVLGVYSDPSVTLEDARTHGKEYGFTFPRVLDGDQRLAKQADVKRIPTAIVLDPSSKIVYRGRIDDRWSPEGKRRDVPRTRELRAAIEAVVAGREPAVREAPTFGCPLPTTRLGK
ncbi:MAG: redoxin family protein [Planctomycetia bacterium]|nr:redoxin family protein [Planctomycetia bacterium]